MTRETSKKSIGSTELESQQLFVAIPQFNLTTGHRHSPPADVHSLDLSADLERISAPHDDITHLARIE